MARQSTYATITPVLTDYMSVTDDPGGTPVHANAELTSLRDLLQAQLTKATITAAANAEAIVSTGYSLTGSNAQSLIDLAGTWNTTGTPTAIKLNVTDTASNAASKLLDLQVGGSSKLNVRKNGRIYGDGSNPYVELSQSSGSTLGYGASSLFIGSTARITTNYSLSLVIDSYTTVLSCDAANTLALRNSTNQQTMNVYGTYTDASNYRRVAITMTTAGVASIAPAGAGTGASGNVLHISGLPTSNPGPGILWNDAGTPAIGT